MKPLTLADIEQELLDLADRTYWADETAERLRALARRIAVQLVTAGEPA